VSLAIVFGCTRRCETAKLVINDGYSDVDMEIDYQTMMSCYFIYVLDANEFVTKP